jgi:hypothetical protein
MCEEFKSALKNYLNELYPGDESCLWDIKELPIYGRCLMASRDIQPNEVIFYDKPLIVGPRVNNYDKVMKVYKYIIIRLRPYACSL